MNKRKLISSMIIALLSFACLCVGVYAAVKAGQNVSASVNFNPNGVFVEMSGQIYRGDRKDTLYPVYEDSTYTLKTCRNFRVLDETENEGNEPFHTMNISSWTFNPVKFFPQQRWIQVKLTFKNLGKQNISVIPTADMPTSITTNIAVYEEAAETLLIEPGETKEYKLNLKLKDSVTTAISNTTFTMPLDIRKTSDIENPASYFAVSNEVLNDMSPSYYSNTIYGERALIIPSSLGIKSTYNYAESETGQLFQRLSLNTKYIIFPNGLTALGDHSFDNGRIINVYLPNSVISIGAYAFKGCSSLTSITLPSSVTSIGGGAFDGCSSLASITIPSGVTSIGSGAFYGCTSLTSVTIPSTVSSIGASAFYGCTSLASVTLPEGLRDINSDTFNGCTLLASITIPSSVTSIGNSAFSDCSSLTSITIPSSVTSIGEDAFWNCISLKYIKMSGNSLKSPYILQFNKNKYWVRSSSASKPTSWTTNSVVEIPAFAGNYYYHQQAAWEK